MKRVVALLFVASAWASLAWGESVVEVEGYGELYGFAKTHDRSEGVGRFIVAPSLVLTPWLKLQSQVGFERPAEDGKWYEGELEVFALEGRMTKDTTISLGKVHVPVGLYNLYHEPIYFLSLEPSRVEGIVIPAEWHETAALVSYKKDQWAVIAGAMTPMDGRKLDGTSWIREGKERHLTDGGRPAWVGRVEWGEIEKVMMGGSFASTPLAGTQAQANVGEIHLTVRLDNGWEGIALVSRGWIDDHPSLALNGVADIRKIAQGASVTVGYDMGKNYGLSQRKLIVFGQSNYAHSALPNASNRVDGNVVIGGINYFLTPKVVLKVQTSAGNHEGERVGCGIGFVY